MPVGNNFKYRNLLIEGELLINLEVLQNEHFALMVSNIITAYENQDLRIHACDSSGIGLTDLWTKL
jgi:hypothetical protein